jgi:hypothetical protein
MVTFSRFHRRRRRPDIGPLLQVPALARARPRQLAELVPHTSSLRLGRGRTVVEAGTTARELIVILAGEAAVLRPDGSQVVFGPGAEIGGREALSHQRHAATVVATSTLDVVVINGPAVRWAHAEGIAELTPSASTPQSEPASRPQPHHPHRTLRLAR